jgi:ketosteroid isomerase-like protein
MLGDAARQTVFDLFAAFAARDPQAADAVLHPDVELWAQPTGELAGRSEPYRGHEGFRDYLADVERVWASFEVSPDDVRVAGAGVICFGHAEGRPRGTAEVRRTPVIWVFRLRDARIVFCRVARTAAEATSLAAEPDEPGRAAAS